MTGVLMYVYQFKVLNLFYPLFFIIKKRQTFRSTPLKKRKKKKNRILKYDKGRKLIRISK